MHVCVCVCVCACSVVQHLSQSVACNLHHLLLRPTRPREVQCCICGTDDLQDCVVSHHSTSRAYGEESLNNESVCGCSNVELYCSRCFVYSLGLFVCQGEDPWRLNRIRLTRLRARMNWLWTEPSELRETLFLNYIFEE